MKATRQPKFDSMYMDDGDPFLEETNAYQNNQKPQNHQNSPPKKETPAPSGCTDASVGSGPSGTSGKHEDWVYDMMRLARRYKGLKRKPSREEVEREYRRYRKVMIFEEFELVLDETIDRAECDLGQGPLAEALRSSNCHHEAAERYTNPQLKALVGLCARLQELSGREPFFLAASSVEDLFGVHQTTAARMLRILVRHKIIAVQEKGYIGRATTYLFTGRRK